MKFLKKLRWVVLLFLHLEFLFGYGYVWYRAVATIHHNPWWVYWFLWSIVFATPLSFFLEWEWWEKQGIRSRWLSRISERVNSISNFSSLMFTTMMVSNWLTSLIKNQKKIDNFLSLPLKNNPLGYYYTWFNKLLWFCLVLLVIPMGMVILLNTIAFFVLFVQFIFKSLGKFYKFLRKNKYHTFVVLFWILNFITLTYSIIYSIQLADEVEINWPGFLLVDNSKPRTATVAFFLFLLFFLPFFEFVAKLLHKLKPSDSETKTVSDESESKGCCGSCSFIYDSIIYGKFREIIKDFYDEIAKLVDGIKKFIKKERKGYFTQCLLTFEWLYFILSIAGIVVAIWYAKTGALISVVSTVEQRINEKAGEWFSEESMRTGELGDISLEEIVISPSTSHLLNKNEDEGNRNLNVLQTKIDQLFNEVSKLKQLITTEELSEEINELKIEEIV